MALRYPKVLYEILFDSVWETLSTFGGNPKHLGAKLGMIAVLHTWGQNLQLHPHLHCIVPKGGVSKAGFWKKGTGKNEWAVYSKLPFGKPENVIEYLGRHTHKIAISNHRILKLDTQNRKVTIRLKDYRKGGEKIILTLSVKEFIRRF